MNDTPRQITLTLAAFEWGILRAALTERRERIAAHRVNDEHGFRAALLAAYDELAEKIKNAPGANF